MTYFHFWSSDKYLLALFCQDFDILVDFGVYFNLCERKPDVPLYSIPQNWSPSCFPTAQI